MSLMNGVEVEPEGDFGRRLPEIEISATRALSLPAQAGTRAGWQAWLVVLRFVGRASGRFRRALSTPLRGGDVVAAGADEPPDAGLILVTTR